MTKFKVEAVYYVEAPMWQDAEHRVSQNLEIPEEVVSKPATNSSTDQIKHAISTRITAQHSQIIFSSASEEEKEKKVSQLREQTIVWMTMALDNILDFNEEYWSDGDRSTSTSN